jgi:hypothetical protein
MGLRTPPFAMVPVALIRAGLRKDAVLIYAALRCYVRPDHVWCWPSLRRLSKDVGRSVNTVRCCLETLRQADWIEIRQRSSRGSIVSHEYRPKAAASILPDVVTRPATDGAAEVSDRVTVRQPTVSNNEHAPYQELIHKNKSENKNSEVQKINTFSLQSDQETLNQKGADSRHRLFRVAVTDYWTRSNPDDEMPWDASEGWCLKSLLLASPRLTLEDFQMMLLNREMSDTDHAARPRTWMANATSYAGGPLDRFGKPQKRHQETSEIAAFNNRSIEEAIELNDRQERNAEEGNDWSAFQEIFQKPAEFSGVGSFVKVADMCGAKVFRRKQ